MIVVSSQGSLHSKISSGGGLGMYVGVQCNGAAPHAQIDHIMSPGYGLGHTREFQFCMDTKSNKVVLATKGFRKELDMKLFNFVRSGQISFMSGGHSRVVEELRGATLKHFEITDLANGAKWALETGVATPAPTPKPTPKLTPAPTLAPTPKPIKSVPLTVTVENVNYAQLLQVGAADDFKKAVQTAVAKEAGDGITTDDVSVELSAGSVVAKVTVKPKSGKPVSSVAKSKLHGKTAVADAVVSGVSAVAGIKKASTGAITASSWATCTECGNAIVTPAVKTKLGTCSSKTTCECVTLMTSVYDGLQNKCCPLEGGDVEKDCHRAKVITSPHYRCISKAVCAFPGFTGAAAVVGQG